MAIVRVKDETVKFDVIAPAGFRILSAADFLAELDDADWIITSGTDGGHSGPTDPHHLGRAYDFSVEGLGADQIIARHGKLTSELGPRFTVLFEVPMTWPIAPMLNEIAYRNGGATAPHLHVQLAIGQPELA